MYLADAASSIVLIGCLFAIHPTPQERSAEPASWRSLIEGIRFLRHQPIIVSTMTLDMVAVLFGGVTALLPIYATDILHVGATGFGWLRAMPSIGSIVMGLVLAVRPPFRRGGHALLWAVIVFGVATIVFGLSRSFPLSLAALFTLGAADNISVIIRATVLQLLTPDSMRGRVSAVAIIFIGTSNEVGEFESGITAQWFGAIEQSDAGDGLFRRRRWRDDAGDRRRRDGHLAAAHAARRARTPRTARNTGVDGSRRLKHMNDEASYICGACGEEIVIPIDVTQGEEQEYVEDCPVCCQANVIHVEIDADGNASVWAELE